MKVLRVNGTVKAQPFAVGLANFLQRQRIERDTARIARGEAQRIEDQDRRDHQDDRHPDASSCQVGGH